MIHPWECDDDGSTWDDSRICWEEIEEFAGPEYRMYREKVETDSKPAWRAPSPWMPTENSPFPCGSIIVQTPKDWFMC